ncbi:MAG: AAA family ATPase [Sulfuriferula sp.]|nr:AAA family ATPase [Sulfuriferula sp.]
MAIFLPVLHSKNLKLTAGERRFGTCLLRNLEDDYHCWFNVPIGPKQRRPDFVVLHPGRGILVLEVKDWKLSTIRGMTRHAAEIETSSGIKTVANPLEQAREYMLEITHLLERDPLLIQQSDSRHQGKLLLPWGYGVVLTNITRKQFLTAGLEAVIPADKVICQDEMTETVEAEALQNQLWGMFNYHFGSVLTLARIDRVRWHLFPEIRIQQGNLFDDSAPDPDNNISKVLPDIVKVMDLEQEKLARNLGDGHRIIHGVAGSGKTLILAYRAMHLNQLKLAKPILVLCFNTSLAAKLQQLLRERGAGDNVHVRHFHGWCKDICDLYQLDLVGTPDQPIYERRVNSVIAGGENGRVPQAQYAAVLIDEGHDFEPDWFKLLVQMIDPETNSLLLMYDDAQNIYGKRKNFSWASVGINASGRTTILKVNYRNTIEALDFAYQFVSRYLDETTSNAETPLIHPEFGGRNGQKPEVKQFANSDDELNHLAHWLRTRINAGIAPQQIAVLCRFNKQAARIQKTLNQHQLPTTLSASEPNKIHILTIHASKGLEFNSVAIPELNAMPHAAASVAEEARLLYVALTRATENTLISYHNHSLFTQQCQALPH